MYNLSIQLQLKVEVMYGLNLELELIKGQFQELKKSFK